MATYQAPIESETDPDAPLTSGIAKRWDNNCIAIAEGAEGAPRVVAGALSISEGSRTGTLSPGQSNNIIMNDYSFFPRVVAVSGSTESKEALSMSISHVDGTSPRFGLSLSLSAATDVDYEVTWKYINT